MRQNEENLTRLLNNLVNLPAHILEPLLTDSRLLTSDLELMKDIQWIDKEDSDEWVFIDHDDIIEHVRGEGYVVFENRTEVTESLCNHLNTWLP